MKPFANTRRTHVEHVLPGGGFLFTPNGWPLCPKCGHTGLLDIDGDEEEPFGLLTCWACDWMGTLRPYAQA